MTDEHLWSDWIEHTNGTECPVAPGTLVHAVFERFSDRGVAEMTFLARADAYDWDWRKFGTRIETSDGRTYYVARIIRYRVRRYGAADKMIAQAKASADRACGLYPSISTRSGGALL